MRKIKLLNIAKPGNTNYIKYNLWAVHLGNDTINRFSNYKNALRFIAETNRFLNLKLYEFNQVYTLILSEYQKNWFYFESNNAEVNGYLTDCEKIISENITAINKSMNLMVTRAHYENGNHLTFKHFFSCIAYCEEIVRHLKKILKQRKHYIEISQLELLRCQLEKLYLELKKYGSDKNIDIGHGEEIELIP